MNTLILFSSLLLLGNAYSQPALPCGNIEVSQTNWVTQQTQFPADQHSCSWYLYSPYSEKTSLFVQVQNFWTLLEVSDGDNIVFASEMYETFFIDMVSTEAVVTFTQTDPTVPLMFVIYYYWTPPADVPASCGASFHNNSGSVSAPTDPSDPANYQNGASCTWYFYAEEGAQFTVDFKGTYLQPNEDFIYITDSDSPNAKGLFYTGAIDQISIKTTGYATVTFVSSSSVNYPAFQFDYSWLPESEPIISS